MLALKSALVVFGILLMASAAVSASPSTCWISDNCKAYVGKRLWVVIPAGNLNTVEVTFSRGDWTTSRTLKLRSGASFVVIAMTKANVGSDEYKVRLDDGRTGWVSSSDPFLIDYNPVARAKAAAAECTRRGEPKIGMSRSELVETCWRKPLRVVKKITAAGTEEIFLYGGGRVVKMQDGKIVEIVESR